MKPLFKAAVTALPKVISFEDHVKICYLMVGKNKGVISFSRHTTTATRRQRFNFRESITTYREAQLQENVRAIA